MPAQEMIAKNETTHSGLFSEKIATLSPFFTPNLISAEDTSTVRLPNSR